MKHSIIKYVFGVLLCGAVSVSCTSYEDVPLGGGDVRPSQQPIDFRAVVSQQYVTRVNDNGFADGDKIGVFIVNYVDDQPQELAVRGNHADNVRFIYNDAEDEWEGAYEIYWKDRYTPVDAYGYYPYDAELSSITDYSFNVQANQNATLATSGMMGYEASDFLWAKSECVYPSSSPLMLTHNHIMAGVQVNLVEGYGFADGEWESVAKQLSIDNTYLNTTINLQSGVVTVDESVKAEAIIPMPSNGGYRAIVAPQVVEAGKPLMSVNIDGIAYTFKRDEAMTYRSGKLHKFTIEIIKRLAEGDYQLNLVSESILPWQNDSQSHNGAAREYITVHVEEGEFIGDVINRMGLEPAEIINLKLTGTLSDHDHFGYIRENIPYLEAVNMKELRTKNQESFYWAGDGTAGNGWGEIPYNQPTHADDYIPRKAFKEMKYLSYVVWPDHLVGIGDEAFVGCNLRGSLIFPEGLKHLGGSVFEGWNSQNSALTGELYLPSTLEYIGGGVFDPADSQKSNITGEFILPPNIKYVGGNAFGACHRMTGKIHIPESLDVIESGMFPPNLTGDAVIPSHIKRVGRLPNKIRSVYLSEGVEELTDGALADLQLITGDIVLPSTIKKLGNYVFANSYFAHVKLSENLIDIPESTFCNCYFLQDTMVIPDKVQYIHKQAFTNCEKLSAVVLPEGLLSIGSWAFSNCRSLEYIECLATEPPALDPSAFDGVEKIYVTLVVPAEAIEAYRNADHWKEFKRITSYKNFVCRPMHADLLNKGGERDVVLNADGNWEVTHTPEWASVDITSGYKKTQLKVTIDDMAHGSGVRSDSIVFMLTDRVDEEGNPITCRYNITQYDYEYDEDTELRLQQATKGNNGGINITFVGDGYNAKDIYDGSYMADVKEGMEYFFGVEPFKTYRDYFNVNIDFALSYESGVCTTVNIWRDTKFSSTYGANQGRLRVEPDQVSSYVLNDVVEGAITEDNINQSVVVCLMNTDAYEGITTLYSSGAAVAFLPHCRAPYPNDFRGLMQHEACGHAFGKLADEYIYHRDNINTCTCLCCRHVDVYHIGRSLGWYRNVSLSGKYSDIEWRHLIFHGDYDDIVDIYEGAFYHSDGVYRSEVNSCMNDNIPYFSTYSRQVMVERIMEYAGEEFVFEEFVRNDSRDIGEYTRSVEGGTSVAAEHNPAPIVIMGSPVDNIKNR